MSMSRTSYRIEILGGGIWETSPSLGAGQPPTTALRSALRDVAGLRRTNADFGLASLRIVRDSDQHVVAEWRNGRRLH